MIYLFVFILIYQDTITYSLYGLSYFDYQERVLLLLNMIFYDVIMW